LSLKKKSARDAKAKPAARRRVQCESAIIIGNDGFVLCKLKERDDHGKSGFALGHRPRATHDVRKCIGGNANNNWPAAIHERHSRLSTGLQRHRHSISFSAGLHIKRKAQRDFDTSTNFERRNQWGKHAAGGPLCTRIILERVN
jgi:hypothetical protein